MLWKFQRLIAEVDGQYVRADGFRDDPLNTPRQVNTTKLTRDILDAKNFNFFKEDIAATQKAWPSARFFQYSFKLTADHKEDRTGLP